MSIFGGGRHGTFWLIVTLEQEESEIIKMGRALLVQSTDDRDLQLVTLELLGMKLEGDC